MMTLASGIGKLTTKLLRISGDGLVPEPFTGDLEDEGFPPP
jgi:hypothetical protein